MTTILLDYFRNKAEDNSEEVCMYLSERSKFPEGRKFVIYNCETWTLTGRNVDRFSKKNSIMGQKEI